MVYSATKLIMLSFVTNLYSFNHFNLEVVNSKTLLYEVLKVATW